MRTRFTILVVLVLVLSVVSSPAGGVAGFGDVGADKYYAEPVQWMVDNSITSGTSLTCFSPGDPVTRGQAAAFMWRMEGSPTGAPPHSFSDVFASWQQAPVSWMVDNSITTGTTTTTYSPDNPVTRGQIAAFLWRLAGSPDAPPAAQFTDVVKSWQITPVGWMVQQEITTGTTASTFSPEDTVTRGQAATFFYRYKDSPAVVVDPNHPANPVCDEQVPAPPTPLVTGTYTYHTFSSTPVRIVSVDAHGTDPVKGTWEWTRVVDPVQTFSGPVTCLRVSGDDAWLAGPTWDGTFAVFMWVHDGATAGGLGDTAFTWGTDPGETLADMEAACESMTTTPFGWDGGRFDVVSGDLYVWDTP